MPKGNPKRPTPRFPREAIVLRFLAGQEHFSRLSPRITAYDVAELAAQGFHMVKHWDQDRMTDVYRPDDLTVWQTRYDEIIGNLPVKRPVGRPTGIPNPGAGRKPKKTWRERYAEDPEGASSVLATIPHELGRELEERAEKEGVSVPALLVVLARRWVEQG